MKNKKKIAAAALFLIIVILVAGIYRVWKRKSNAESTSRSIPQMRFEALDGGSFSTAELPAGKCVIINYFDPGCGTCQYMTGEIARQRDRLQDVSLVMISQGDRAATAEFARRYHVDHAPDIRILLEGNGSFFNIFGTSVTPAYFIYSKEGRLKKRLLGEFDINQLLNTVSNVESAR
jgi:hypothetical protein